MADKKFSQFTAGSTNQVPTDELVGLDLSLSTANQNTRWTLNNLFSTITRNITDGALRFGGFAAPAVSGAGAGAIYFDSASNLFRVSVNGGAYTNLGDLTGSFGAPGQVAYASASKVLTGSTGLTFDAATSALTLGTSALPGGLRLVGTSGTYWNIASQNPAANKTLYLPNSTTPTTGNFLFVSNAGVQTQTDWSTGLTWSNSTNQLTVTASNSNQIGFAVQNTSAGTAAESVLGFTANGGAISLLSLTGTGFTTAGLYRANQLYWRGTTGITEMLFALDDASTAFKFGVNNAVAASINATATEGLVLGIASNLTGRIKLFNSAGATFTQISAGNAAASLNYILPAVSPTAGQVLQAGAPSGGNVTLSWAAGGGGGGGTPGGSDTQLQYNNAGAFGGLATLTTDGSVLTMTRDNISNTSTDGIILTNTTPAADGIQQWSPRVRFTGQGWRTASGGSSMPVDFVAEVQTVQGTSVPTGSLVISNQVNNGGLTPRFTFGNTGTFTADAAVVAPQLTAGIAASLTGQLTLFNASGSTSTSIQAGNAASSLIYRLPTVDPTSGQVLSASAPSGGVVTLSWQSVAGGTGNPGGTGSELQFRSNATTFGGLTGSSVTGSNLTLAGTLTVDVLTNTPSTSASALVFPTNDVNGAPFGLRLSTFANSFGQTQNNHVMVFGYNPGKQVGTEAEFALAIESKYRTSLGTDQTEFYFSFQAPGGGAYRPFSINAIHSTGATEVGVNSGSFTINGANYTNYWTFSTNTLTLSNNSKIINSSTNDDWLQQSGLRLANVSSGTPQLAIDSSSGFVRLLSAASGGTYTLQIGPDALGAGRMLRFVDGAGWSLSTGATFGRILAENMPFSYVLSNLFTIDTTSSLAGGVLSLIGAPVFTTPLLQIRQGTGNPAPFAELRNAANTALLTINSAGSISGPSAYFNTEFGVGNTGVTGYRAAFTAAASTRPALFRGTGGFAEIQIEETSASKNYGLNVTTTGDLTFIDRAAAVTRFISKADGTFEFRNASNAITLTVLTNGALDLLDSSSISRSQNNATALTISNINAGASARALLTLTADGGSLAIYRTSNAGGVANTAIYQTDGGAPHSFYIAGNRQLNITNSGVGVGTAVFGTSATNTLAIANGTSPTTFPADINQLLSRDSAAGDSNLIAFNEAGQETRLTGVVKVLNQNFARTVDTRANVAGTNTNGSLVFNVEAGKRYTFRAVLHIDADVTGGVSIGIDGTATATSFIAQFCSWNNGSGANAGITRLTSFGGGTGFAGVTNLGVIIEGSIVVNAAGTINVQFGQNTASGTSTVLAGSSFTIAQA